MSIDVLQEKIRKTIKKHRSTEGSDPSHFFPHSPVRITAGVLGSLAVLIGGFTMAMHFVLPELYTHGRLPQPEMLVCFISVFLMVMHTIPDSFFPNFCWELHHRVSRHMYASIEPSAAYIEGSAKVNLIIAIIALIAVSASALSIFVF